MIKPSSVETAGMPGYTHYGYRIETGVKLEALDVTNKVVVFGVCCNKLVC